MNTLLANVMVGNAATAVEWLREKPVARKAPHGAARNVALAVAAPFIGLAFVVLFPIAGLAMLAWLGARALARRAGRIARFAKNVALFLAAPFVGLAYTLAFPVIGAGMLACMAARGLMKRHGTA